MNDNRITFDDQNNLLCPQCGGNYTHIDTALVSGRPREDGPIVPVRVDHAGNVLKGANVSVPIESGRRHAIGVQGSCETCGTEFVIEFAQHKGQTQVKVLQQRWV